MKNILLTGAILFASTTIFAQTNTFPSSGNVGIGTITPSAPLEVYKAENSYIRVRAGGGSYSFLNLTDGSTSGYLIKNNNGSFANGATMGALYTYVDEGYDFQHIENAQPRLTIKSGGNIGIGTSSPDTKLHIKGSNNMFKLENSDDASNQFTQMNFKAGTANNYIWTNNQNSSGFYGGSGALNIFTGQNSPIAFFTNGDNERFRIGGDGNVAIGTTDPKGYKLAVNGSMIAESVRVKLHVNWPDYVFQPGYKLRSLSATEQFIKTNGHLPEIPSAAVVEKEGVELGEMNRKLLQKVEELTLHLIRLEKEIKKLKTNH